MIILGIESTCDETSVGVVENGRKVLSNVVASSSLMHEKYGGIVPEVAAREQVKVIIPTLSEALQNVGVDKVDAIAVAYGPGLVGSLLIGVETAKAIAFAWNKPIIGVNHLVGHLYANWIEKGGNIKFPAIGLVVSGGHTDLILIKSHSESKWLGGTLDDAAGEVFDKVSRILELGFPGGPAIEKTAAPFIGQRLIINLPLPMSSDKSFNFSYSGIKTAVANVHTKGNYSREQIAYEFQERMCQSLVNKTFAAVKKYDVASVVVGGGVAANQRLRDMFEKNCNELGVKLFFPEKKYSIDNGAMIATAAYYHQNFIKVSKLQSNPSLYFA